MARKKSRPTRYRCSGRASSTAKAAWHSTGKKKPSSGKKSYAPKRPLGNQTLTIKSGGRRVAASGRTKSYKRDARMKAKYPGKRITPASGRVYYERRENRSDKNPSTKR